MFKKLITAISSRLSFPSAAKQIAVVPATDPVLEALSQKVAEMDVEEKRCILAYFRMLDVLAEIRHDLSHQRKPKWNIADMCRIYAGVESQYLVYGYRSILPMANYKWHTDADIVDLMLNGTVQRRREGEDAQVLANVLRRNIERSALRLEKQVGQG